MTRMEKLPGARAAHRGTARAILVPLIAGLAISTLVVGCQGSASEAPGKVARYDTETTSAPDSNESCDDLEKLAEGIAAEELDNIGTEIGEGILVGAAVEAAEEAAEEEAQANLPPELYNLLEPCIWLMGGAIGTGVTGSPAPMCVVAAQCLAAISSCPAPVCPPEDPGPTPPPDANTGPWGTSCDPGSFYGDCAAPNSCTWVSGCGTPDSGSYVCSGGGTQPLGGACYSDGDCGNAGACVNCQCAPTYLGSTTVNCEEGPDFGSPCQTACAGLSDPAPDCVSRCVANTTYACPPDSPDPDPCSLIDCTGYDYCFYDGNGGAYCGDSGE